MKLILCLAALFFTHFAVADDKALGKEIYVVVHGKYTPGVGKSLYLRIKESNMVCYPMKVRENEFSEEVFKKAFELFITDRDEEGQISRFQCEFFEDRNEAVKLYKELTTQKKREYKRVPFTRAHVERTRDKFFAEKEEKTEPVMTKETEPVKPRNIDDIYD